MTIENIAENFLQQIQQFSYVVIKQSKNPQRKNVYITPARKRWMQVDINSTCLNVSMDHLEGELSITDVLSTGLPIWRNGLKNGISLTPSESKFDAVHFTFLQADPYDFSNEAFTTFLKKHHDAYLKRVNLF